MRRLFLPVAAALTLGVTACAKKAQSEASAPTTAAAPASAANATGSTLTGTLLEKIDASSYSYLRLQTAEGETWAAVPSAALEKGAVVTIRSSVTMVDFQSPSLKRKFDKIVFGTVVDPEGAGAAGEDPHAGTAMGRGPTPSQAHASLAKSDVDMDVKVPKAEGQDAHTVAEVYAGKTALAGKTVVVRGKVVKYNSGILGRNWVHLRDGSGTSTQGDNDLTVTTDGEAKVGDVVVAKGVLRTDKDFGAGYTYPVIVEEASLTK